MRFIIWQVRVGFVSSVKHPPHLHNQANTGTLPSFHSGPPSAPQDDRTDEFSRNWSGFTFPTKLQDSVLPRGQPFATHCPDYSPAARCWSFSLHSLSETLRFRAMRDSHARTHLQPYP